MQKVIKLALIVLSLSALSACSNIKFPGVYKVKIQQGNYIDQEMIEKLEAGLTKRQVRFIMGSPMIEDSFNQHRWDYFYNLKVGDKKLRDNHFVIYFEDDKVTHWDGDYSPIKKQVEDEQNKALKDTKRKKDAKLD